MIEYSPILRFSGIYNKRMSYTTAFVINKITAIGYVTTLYFVFGLLLAKIFDTIYGKFKKDAYEKGEKSLFWLGLEIIFHMFIIAVLLYLLRNIVGLIPYPLDNVGGYEHSRLKELQGPAILSAIIVMFQKNFTDKTAYFVKRMFR